MKPEEYKALYEKHNAIPVRCRYVGMLGDGKSCGCAVGIRLIDFYGSRKKAEAAIEAVGVHKAIRDANLFTKDFLFGLITGWDYGVQNVQGDEAEYLDGYAEGIAASKLLQPESYRKIKWNYTPTA